MNTAPAPANAGPPVAIWQYLDGRRGHENQSTALVEALGEIVATEVVRIRVPAGGSLRCALQALHSRGQPDLPRARIVVGAGHATHAPLIAAGLAQGARTVVLMAPSIPSAVFSLTIAPAHDGVRPGPRTLVTRGVLNRVRPATPKIDGAGLILIGGPSKHHLWSTRDLAEQIATVVQADPDFEWTLTDSPRTPADCLPVIERLGLGGTTIVSHKKTDASWLPSRLGLAERVWVTADSVNMVYESLSAGAATGILEVPARSAGSFGRVSRVVSGLEGLVAERIVTPFAQWRGGATLTAPAIPLAEAARCARWIAQHWLRPASS